MRRVAALFEVPFFLDYRFFGVHQLPPQKTGRAKIRLYKCANEAHIRGLASRGRLVGYGKQRAGW
jgi:hypothetical protein